MFCFASVTDETGGDELMIHSLGPYSQYSGHCNMCTISDRDDGVFYEGIHVQMALPVRITIYIARGRSN